MNLARRVQIEMFERNAQCVPDAQKPGPVENDEWPNTLKEYQTMSDKKKVNIKSLNALPEAIRASAIAALKADGIEVYESNTYTPLPGTELSYAVSEKRQLSVRLGKRRMPITLAEFEWARLGLGESHPISKVIVSLKGQLATEAEVKASRAENREKKSA